MSRPSASPFSGRARSTICMVMSSPDRCVFPLRAGGVHRHPEATPRRRRSLRALLEGAAQRPRGPVAAQRRRTCCWARYPAGVPAGQLLGPELFQSESRVPRFIDVAGPARLGRDDIAGGTIADDFDGDGLLDVFFTQRRLLRAGPPLSQPRRRHLRGSHGGGRPDARQLGGLNAIADRLQQRRPPRPLRACAAAGKFAMRNSLLRNNARRHLHRRHARGRALERRVLDALGGVGRLRQRWLGRSVRRPRARAEPAVPQSRRRHLRGRHRHAPASARPAFTKGVDRRRLRQRRLPGSVRLEHVRRQLPLSQQRRRHLRPDVAAGVGVAEAVRSFPTWFFDYDNDGWLDIFVAVVSELGRRVREALPRAAAAAPRR